MSTVVVVGGGAAGSMAAIAAAEKGHAVTLLEKNEKIGKKLYLTGKGRCNVTNACETRELFSHVVSNPKFLYSAIYGFDNQKVREFFEESGCRLKTERGNRVFPVSDHSSDVIRALTRRLEQDGVNVRLHTRAQRILTQEDAGGRFKVNGIRLQTKERLKADAVILACGGLSYPATGSTGDGYRLAQEVGHTLVPTSPSLVPFKIREDFCRRLQGLSLRNVEVLLRIQGERVYSGFGELVFTHFGVSGPLILTASCYYQQWIARKRPEQKVRGTGENRSAGEQTADDAMAPRDEDCRLILDLKPAVTPEQLDKRLLRTFDENRNKRLKNAVEGFFPARLTPVMLDYAGLDQDKPVREVTKQERAHLIDCIKHFTLTVSGTRGYEEAMVTRGGIPVKEIYPSTMESRLVEGLYFAGEMIDVDALTGGYNLQIAWSTGRLAGSSIP